MNNIHLNLGYFPIIIVQNVCFNQIFIDSVKKTGHIVMRTDHAANSVV